MVQASANALVGIQGAEAGGVCLLFFLKPFLVTSGLQIRRSNKDNSEIIFLLSQ